VILVDTSIWIDYFTGKKTSCTEFLHSAIENSEDLCTCGPVITEILQGIRNDKEYDTVKAIVSGLIYLPITKNMFIHASSIYRTIRKSGKTVRSPIDCIIASVCLEHEATLLHNDKDFDLIAQFASLQIAK